MRRLTGGVARNVARGMVRGAATRFVRVALAVGMIGAALLPQPAFADGAWLDDAAVTWNTPGMPLPRSQEHRGGETDPRCAAQARPAESDQDRAVMAAGWTLFAGYSGGWGVQIVRGLAGYDGMCRPVEYQSFVFVDGQFAGTMSPMPMDSRSDGALSEFDFWGPDRMTAQYNRYTPQDALCCPSGRSIVQFKVERTPGGPVLVRGNTSTQPTGAAVRPPAAPPTVPPPAGRASVPAPAQVPPSR